MIRIIQKSYTSDWQNINPWVDQTPFLPPWGRAEVQLEFVTYSLHAMQGTAQVQVVGGSPPSTWDVLVSRTIIIACDADLNPLGFEADSCVLYVRQGGSYVGFAVHIINISQNAATIVINSRLFSSAIPVIFSTTPEYLALFQNHTDKPHYATLTNASQAGAFASPYTGTAPSVPNPSALPVTFSAGNSYTVFLDTAQTLTINSRIAVIQAYNFLPVLTQLNPSATAPQGLYERDVALLFGRSQAMFVALPLATCEPNLYQNNTPVAASVVLSGTNGAWTITASPAPLATYVALHNDTAAHTASLPHAGGLLQTGGASTAFTLVPPFPRVLAVAVYYAPTKGFGVRVSNVVSILPPQQEDFELEVVGTVESDRVFAATRPNHLLPWDALAAELRTAVSAVYYLRFWAVFRLQSGAEFLLEEWDFTPPPYFPTPQDIDITRLLHFVVPDDLTYLPHIAPSDKDLFTGHNTSLNKSILRTYLAKYLNRRIAPAVPLVPDTAGVGRVVLCCAAETSSGPRYAEVPAGAPNVIDSAQWTNHGTWHETDTQVTWKVTTQAPLVWRVLYRCAVFLEDFSATPLAQVDNTHPTSPDINVAMVESGIIVTFRKPTAPGRYVLLVRVAVANVEALLENLCEYYVLDVPAPLPVPTPAGDTDCPPCVPVEEGEAFPLLFPEAPDGVPTTPAGDWYQYVSPPVGDVCFSRWHCGLVRVPQVSAEWVDLVCTFDNRVWGRSVQGTHMVRAVGVLRRLDDIYSAERYITKDLEERDIIRSYTAQYEVELFVQHACQLFSVELAKFAKKIKVVARRGLIREVDNLYAEDFAINDLGKAYKVRIKLRPVEWRKEYRY